MNGFPAQKCTREQKNGTKKNGIRKDKKQIQWYDAPCREYLPTLGEKWPHSSGNVGKYSLHGAYGNGMMMCMFFSAETSIDARMKF